jgi:hypothetical protein
LNRAARITTIAFAAAGIVACVVLLAVVWIGPAETPLARLAAATGAISAIIVLCVAVVIAWRGADHRPNLALALAMAVVFATWPLEGLTYRDVLSGSWVQPVMWVWFLLGAGLFIRASQLFPAPILPAELVASPTVWGRIPVLRRGVSALLRPAWTWAYAALLTAIAVAPPLPSLQEAARLAVILSGVVFFYIRVRSDDRAAARRVLWFFAAALLALLLGMLRLGFVAALAPSMTANGRIFTWLLLYISEQLILVGGIVGAVFYAGAINPALVIRKTLVFGATAGALLFAFAIVQALIADALVDFFGVTDRLASAFMGTLLGLAFEPLRKRVERLLKRLEPAEILSLLPPEPKPDTLTG